MRHLGRGVVVASVAGVVSALLGIGGGIVKVPLMNLSMGVPLRVATATSNMMIGITAAASALIYAIHGGLDVYVAGPTAIGVFIGATVGSRFGHVVDLRVPAPAVRDRPGLHGHRDAAVGCSDERRDGGRSRGRGRTGPRRGTADRRLLIAVTYVSVGLLSIGVVLMLADGISPTSGGPPLDLPSLAAGIVALDPAAFLWSACWPSSPPRSGASSWRPSPTRANRTG